MHQCAAGAVVQVLAQRAVEQLAGREKRYAELGWLESRRDVVFHSHVLC
jgi:hypothetical protein